MIHDQHCHTSYSVDSNEDLEHYFKIADNFNVEYLVTTEHIEFNSVYNNQDWTVDFDGLKNYLTVLHKKYPKVNPLLGVEIGYRKEYLDRMHQTVISQPFDVINMSIHDDGVHDYYLKEVFIDFGITKLLDVYFNNILEALDNFNDFDVLSHFDYGFKTAYLIDNSLSIKMYENIVRKIFKKVISLNKTLEINMKVQNTINDLNHTKTILMWYKEEGGTKITLSSDAHNKDAYKKYYEDLNKYISLIKECGFNHLTYFIKRVEHNYDI